MKPRKPSSEDPQGHLYRIELSQLIDLEHPLAKLAAVVDWSRFDEAFAPLYDPGQGRRLSRRGCWWGCIPSSTSFGSATKK